MPHNQQWPEFSASWFLNFFKFLGFYNYKCLILPARNSFLRYVSVMEVKLNGFPISSLGQLPELVILLENYFHSASS